ncbi:MAG TPA: hypothetical protein VNU47_01340 [Candidatus Paceibacterota bacterium]|nr:hypothetical protein [Candidatus Paceibacterota bacterium]
MSDHHHNNYSRGAKKKGIHPLIWVLIIIAIIAGIWYFFMRTPAEAFTIGAGEGLVHYVSYQESIDRAEACGLPVYMGKGASAVQITYDEARGLESMTDRVQVTVPLQIGDVFGPKVDDCPARTLYR